MAKHLVEVTDGAGIKRMVKAVDAREIEASVNAALSAKADAKFAEADAKNAEADAKLASLALGADGPFPKDFPGSEAFTAEGVGYHQALRMTKEELTAVKGIGEATADKVLKHRGA